MISVFFWTHLEFFSCKEMCLCDVSFLRYKAKKLVNFWKWTTFGGFKKYLNHICRYLLWFLWFTSSILKMLLNLFWNWSIFGLIIENILFDVFFNKMTKILVLIGDTQLLMFLWLIEYVFGFMLMIKCKYHSLEVTFKVIINIRAI